MVMTKLHCIFVIGVAGCGKTTIGQRLAEEIGAKFVDADDYHSQENRLKMANGIALNDEDRFSWLEKLADIVAESPRPLVLACSALKPLYRQMLSSKLHENFIFLHLDVARHVLVERLETRNGHFFNPRLLDSQIDTLDVKKNENYIRTLNGNGSIEETVKKALDILRHL